MLVQMEFSEKKDIYNFIIDCNILNEFEYKLMKYFVKRKKKLLKILSVNFISDINFNVFFSLMFETILLCFKTLFTI